MNRKLIGVFLVSFFVLTFFSTRVPLSSSASQNNGSGTPQVSSSMLDFPVAIKAVDEISNRPIPLTSTDAFVSSASGQVLFSGQLISSLNLPNGEYSFEVQTPYGFNALLYQISGPTQITIPVGPYVMGNLENSKMGRSIYRPTDPSTVMETVFAINQTDTLPTISMSTNNASPNTPCCCNYYYWVLYNNYDMGVQDQLQGAIYSWGYGSTDQISNSPTPSQYSASDSYVSFNGGGMTQSGDTTQSVTSSETLPTACTYCGGGQPLNYDVYMQGTWHDYIYRQYYGCSRQWIGGVKENVVMTQGGNFYQYNSYAYSTGDYSFSYFWNIGVGATNEQTVDLTLSNVGTNTQGFSAEATLCLGSGDGGSFSGCFDVAGYTGLNSQSSGTQVMYQIGAYGYCEGFEIYRSGWVLGWSQGSASC